jgi:hypothetical protein
LSFAQNHESKPRTMQLNSGRCNPTAQPVPISETEALAKLNQITQVMLNCDAAALSSYSSSTQLNFLMQGGSTTDCMASLANGVEFTQQVWQIAVGAAFDFCAAMLGIDQSPDAPALRLGMICNYFNPAVNPNVQEAKFGWMISSLVGQDAWIRIDPNCDHIPSPLPPTAYPEPCPAS